MHKEKKKHKHALEVGAPLWFFHSNQPLDAPPCAAIVAGVNKSEDEAVDDTVNLAYFDSDGKAGSATEVLVLTDLSDREHNGVPCACAPGTKAPKKAEDKAEAPDPKEHHKSHK